jgi:hypothetical protein
MSRLSPPIWRRRHRLRSIGVPSAGPDQPTPVLRSARLDHAGMLKHCSIASDKGGSEADIASSVGWKSGRLRWAKSHLGGNAGVV